MIGFTGEEINASGEKILKFDYNRVSYQINDQGIATAILVSDAKVDSETMSIVNKTSVLKSNDETIFLIKTQRHDLIFNKVNGNVQIKQN